MDASTPREVVDSQQRLSRRSFLNLALLGIGASAASGLLAACTAGAPVSPTAAPGAGGNSAPSSSSAAAATGQPVAGGTLTWASPFGTNIDVMAVLQTGVNQFGLWGYDGLFDWGPDQKVRPMLVKSEQISADALTVTWQLQEGVKFHDGTPFNAEAVKWNLERKINKKYSPFDLLPFKTVDVVNDTTTSIKLDHPYAGLSAVLANRSFAMYSPTFVEKNGDDAMKTQACGTGPYMVTEFRTNDSILLKKNPDYWQRGLPYFDNVVIKIVQDANTRATMLASGDADVATEILAPDFQRFKTTPGIKVIEGLGSQQWYITINTQRPGLDDKQVRQALNYAVDKDGIVQAIYLGSAKPAQAMFATPGLDGFTSAGVYEYNPEKAKQLLDAAGWSVGSDGVRDAQIIQMVHDDAPLIQLVDLNQRIAMRDNIQGIYLDGPPNNFSAQFAWRSS